MSTCGTTSKILLRILAPLAAAAVTACDASPTAPTSWSEARLREQLVLSNLNASVFGATGRSTRWRVPIVVNTNGIVRAETALAHYEQWTSGVVRFVRTTSPVADGLTFVEGGAGGREATDACGIVISASGGAEVFQVDSSRAIVGAYTIHLGSDRCDDEREGPYPSAVAEHQLAHALGVIDHFDGFQHRTGLDDPRLLGVVYNLYANPIGVTAGELTIWRAP